MKNTQNNELAVCVGSKIASMQFLNGHELIRLAEVSRRNSCNAVTDILSFNENGLIQQFVREL
jgi:hypothetical protein